MGTKQSKQEKRLAKGLADQAAKAAETVVVVVPSAQVVAEVAPEQPEMENAFGHDLGALEGKLEAAAAPEAPKAAGPVLQVKQGLTLRGGRGEWYKLLCKYDGRPVAEFIADGKANPASHYTARSTKCGQPKTPESRLSWFKRAGIVTIKE